MSSPWMGEDAPVGARRERLQTAALRRRQWFSLLWRPIKLPGFVYGKVAAGHTRECRGRRRKIMASQLASGRSGSRRSPTLPGGGTQRPLAHYGGTMKLVFMGGNAESIRTASAQGGRLGFDRRAPARFCRGERLDRLPIRPGTTASVCLTNHGAGDSGSFTSDTSRLFHPCAAARSRASS